VTGGLRIRGLRVTIDGATILAGIDVDVVAGGWLAVIGPNGAGKTTMLRCLAGSIGYEGSVQLEGRDLGGLATRHRAQTVAVVPQNPVFPDGMSVTDYVLLGRTPHISLFGFEGPRDKHVAGSLLGDLGLEGLARRPISTLSGGERQRAVIARALAQEPSVLLLDEPTTALDLGHQHEVLSLVDELRLARSLTVVSALHDLTLAGQYAEHFLLLKAGAVVADGTAAEVLVPELLGHCYGTPVTVVDSDGTLVVVPPRPGRRAGGLDSVADPEVRAIIRGTHGFGT
jgi:cobalamin transport system ATP-binding protein